MSCTCVSDENLQLHTQVYCFVALNSHPPQQKPYYFCVCVPPQVPQSTCIYQAQCTCSQCTVLWLFQNKPEERAISIHQISCFVCYSANRKVQLYQPAGYSYAILQPTCGTFTQICLLHLSYSNTIVNILHHVMRIPTYIRIETEAHVENCQPSAICPLRSCSKDLLCHISQDHPCFNSLSVEPQHLPTPLYQTLSGNGIASLQN